MGGWEACHRSVIFLSVFSDPVPLNCELHINFSVAPTSTPASSGVFSPFCLPVWQTQWVRLLSASLIPVSQSIFKSGSLSSAGLAVTQIPSAFTNLTFLGHLALRATDQIPDFIWFCTPLAWVLNTEPGVWVRHQRLSWTSKHDQEHHRNLIS